MTGPIAEAPSAVSNPSLTSLHRSSPWGDRAPVIVERRPDHRRAVSPGRAAVEAEAVRHRRRHLGNRAGHHASSNRRAPSGMVYVRGASDQTRCCRTTGWTSYKSRFKRFVDAGGYRDPLGGVVRCRRAFPRDRPARPGNVGTGHVPEGQADYPVSGVSWHEAAAYAEFANKRLPTVSFHWRRAVGNVLYRTGGCSSREFQA